MEFSSIFVALIPFVIGVLVGIAYSALTRKNLSKEEERLVQEQELFIIRFSTIKDKEKAQNILDTDQEETKALAKQAKDLGLM